MAWEVFRDPSAGALGLADDGLADVRGDGLPVFLGSGGDQGGLVVAQVDAQDLTASVGVLGPAGHWGHGSESSESTRGMSRPGLDFSTLSSTFTSMNSTRETVALGDEHPDFDHIDAAPCTHTAITPEHITLCCRDGADCDICGQLIPGLILDPRNGPDSVVVCATCADLEEI